jgi:hypothetical protein
MKVIVFKTSVDSADQVSQLRPWLDTLAGDGCWNFALDDCDRILRVVSDSIKPQAAIRILEEHGFSCYELE